jgi:hypothetical protein
MKLKNKRIRVCALLIAIVLLLSAALFGCSRKGEVVMQIGKQKLTVNTYELMLSRMKGTLKYNGHPTDTESFWNTIISVQGGTYNDYFCHTVQEEAKMMLIKLYLFEEVYKLELPSNYYDTIDEYIGDALDLLHDGSKTAFNSKLAEYGVNMDMLRENYIMEDKIDYLKLHLSKQTGDTARDEYYQKNYVRFRQILLPLYEYLYETDENGDTVYYKEGTDRIYYDMDGVTKKGTDGKTIVDGNGDTVYYTEDGKIAYNTKKGVTRGIDKDKDGYTDYKMLDKESAQLVKDQAEKLKEVIEAGDFSTFEDYGKKMSEEALWSAYPNGMYINKNKNYSIAYLDDMQEALTNMAVGDIALIEADNAYHLIMKYEIEAHGYKNDANKDWFEEFEDEVVSEILDAMCQKYMDQVKVNTEALEKAMDMKTIGSNTDY